MSESRSTDRPSDFSPGDLFEQIERLKGALERERGARLEAEQTATAKADLLATVSHEIRTPLGAIISMAELLTNTQLDDTQRGYAETLRQSGRGLLTILNNVLDYSKLTVGRFELETVPFDFGGMVRSVEADLSARASEKGLDCSIRAVDGCPDTFIGDPVRLRQVLNNLIDNALKFTEQGTIRLRIGFGAKGQDARLRFEVCDTGIGLSEAQQARLFKPYAQGDASVGARYGGTGLGLSIARELVELMGGDLGCESVRGKGSVFWFWVPLRIPDVSAEPKEGPPASAQEPDIGKLAGHVLIAEDNDVNQLLIKAFLDSFGLTHDVAANGLEAVDAAATGRFDLVLMDIMMPELNGVEATQRIRALPGSEAAVPIIALTANAMTGDRDRYLAAGMNGYISKPVGTSELYAVLSEHLPALEQRAAACN